MFARRLLTLLVLLTLTARSLVPMGFMLAPAQDANGPLTVVICTGHGPLIAHHTGGGPAPAHPGPSDTGLCPYAAGGAVTLGDGTPPAPEHPAEYVAVAYRLPSEPFRAAPAAGVASARGPPLTSV